jgi:hypothetical protein
MSVRVKKPHSALKHGGYSAIGLLPGENRAAFEKLHRDLQAEFCSDGPFEEDIVADIARCMWRKKNLYSFRIAADARKRHSAIRSEMIPSTTEPEPFFPEYSRDDWVPPTAAEVEAATEAAEARTREELGENYKFVEMGDLATPAQMLAELDLEERLDARIERLFERLAALKAFKSLSSAKSRMPTELPRISGPKKAA